MSGKLVYHLAGSDIPEPGEAIVTADGNLLAVRRKSNTADCIGLRRKGGDCFARAGIPQPVAEHVLPIRREGDTRQVIRVAFQEEEGLAASHIPDTGGLVRA